MSVNAIDYDGLVEEARVHGDCYVDPAIFDDELERIFYRSWVYVGHEAEVPDPGDFKQGWIGRQSVLLIRGEDREVRVLMNRCAHRAATLCQTYRGNARVLRCAYHGWSYGCDGRLRGMPYADGYGPNLDKDQWSLTSPPRVDRYRGFVFASVACEGVSLVEHLGRPVMEQLDLFCDLSPQGELLACSGTNKYGYDANWKLQMENSIDGYHPNFAHQAFFQVIQQRTGARIDLFAGNSACRTRDLGRGHSMLEYPALNLASPDARPSELLKRSAWGERYWDDMVAGHGERRAEEVIRSGGTHMHVFPNLVVLQNQLRTIRPVNVDRTEVLLSPVLLAGAPDELNAERLRAHETFYGPAGGGVPDDIEMFIRVRAGLECRVDPWLRFERGLHREKTDADGTRYGQMTDEVPQRAMWRHWKRLMTGEAKV